ncbi:MAG TPA: class I SAM-dependent methyltransferase [Acidobacteriaceae bacterium]|jgi:SAM-dependent methyltransferase
MEPNVTRFDGRVADYDRYRERYDAKVVLPLLRAWCNLTPQWRVADVGAGTGMLADVLLANENQVIAIEPNQEMRAMCAHLHADAPLLEIREGTGEDTGLPDASVDAVFVGRALHWFDLDRSMEEFRRVLRPGGWVIVVALGRTEKGREENGAFEQVLRSTSPGHKDTHAAYTVYGRLPGFFDGGEFHHKVILGEKLFDWESLLGMTLSLSHSPRVTAPEFPQFERTLRGFFDHYSHGGLVALETRYWINAGRFPGR